MSAQDTVLNGRYRLLQQQGSGGMAVVYKAHDLALGRTVAIKILRPSLTGDPAFLTRFRQEARNVANLAHPNIVTLHDFGQDGNTYYMVMEFIDGQDLKKMIRQGAPFTVERALHIAIQISAGIGYAHRAGLIHADVKPQNILMMGNDTVKVTDFGIAQALSAAQNQERQSVVWGSPHYFAPEQASGEPPTPASDVYAIGIVMYEMLTGKLPYNGADQQELALAHIREAIPHVQTLNPSVPVHLDRIIYKVMAKTPSDRYRTADQLGRILIEYQKAGNQYTGAINATPSQPAPAVDQPAPVAIRGNTPQPPNNQPVNPSSGYSQPASARQPNVAQSAPQPVPVRPAQQQPPKVQQPNYGSGQGGYAGQNNQVGQGYPQNQSPNPGQAAQQNAYVPLSQSQQVANQNSPASGIFNTPSNYADSNSYRSDPAYQVTPAPPAVDVISIVLGIIAFIAIIGLVILWLAVWTTWTR